MKKRLIILSVLLVIGLIIIFIITMPKKNNWVYEIHDNYEIVKTSDTDIYLEKDKKKMVNEYVSEFSYGEKFIMLKTVDTDVNVKFYIIDTSNDSIYGPFTDYEVFNKIKEEVVDEEVSEWIDTINYKK